MPRGRKSTGATSTRSSNRQQQQRQQSTLSFNQRASKVTKSSLSAPLADKKSTTKLNKAAEEEVLSQVENSKPEVTEIKVEPEAKDHNIAIKTEQEEEVKNIDLDTTPRPASRKRKLRTSTGSTVSTKAEQQSIDAAVEQADSVTNIQIKKYWQAEEDARLAPRINQQSLSMHEKILRHFDLSSQYGPCIGIPRLSRWVRAHTLNLSPPIEVLAVLLRENQKGEDKNDGSRTCGRMAYVDELAGGRSIAVE